MAKQESKVRMYKIRKDLLNKTVEGQIMSDNQSIEKRLRSVKPKIGTKRQWESHYQNFKTYEKKLKKYSLTKEYDPEKELAKTLNSFKRTNRE